MLIKRMFKKGSQDIQIVVFPVTDNCEETVKTVLKKVRVLNVKIERADRDGSANPTRLKHILAKLSFYHDKIKALKLDGQPEQRNHTLLLTI